MISAMPAIWEEQNQQPEPSKSRHRRNALALQASQKYHRIYRLYYNIIIFFWHVEQDPSRLSVLKRRQPVSFRRTVSIHPCIYNIFYFTYMYTCLSYVLLTESAVITTKEWWQKNWICMTWIV